MGYGWTRPSPRFAASWRPRAQYMPNPSFRARRTPRTGSPRFRRHRCKGSGPVATSSTGWGVPSRRSLLPEQRATPSARARAGLKRMIEQLREVEENANTTRRRRRQRGGVRGVRLVVGRRDPVLLRQHVVAGLRHRARPDRPHDHTRPLLGRARLPHQVDRGYSRVGGKRGGVTGGQLRSEKKEKATAKWPPPVAGTPPPRQSVIPPLLAVPALAAVWVAVEWFRGMWPFNGLPCGTRAIRRPRS